VKGRSLPLVGPILTRYEAQIAKGRPRALRFGRRCAAACRRDNYSCDTGVCRRSIRTIPARRVGSRSDAGQRGRRVCTIRFDAYDYWPGPPSRRGSYANCRGRRRAAVDLCLWTRLHRGSDAPSGQPSEPRAPALLPLRTHITLARKGRAKPLVPQANVAVPLGMQDHSVWYVSDTSGARASVYTVVDTWQTTG